MGNPFNRLWQVFSALKYSKRTLTIVAVLAILAILPVTVLLSQQEQDIRQRAAEVVSYSCKAACLPGVESNVNNSYCVKPDKPNGCDPNTERCCKRTTIVPDDGGTTEQCISGAGSRCGFGYGDGTCCAPWTCSGLSATQRTGTCVDSGGGGGGSGGTGHFYCDTSLKVCRYSVVDGPNQNECSALNQDCTGGSAATKTCHDCGTSGIKYCGAETWEQPKNTTCSNTYPNRQNIKKDQVVCQCTGGSETQGCGTLTRTQVNSQCNTTGTDNCNRCSDVYKFCSVSFPKVNGACRNELDVPDADKTYTKACNTCNLIGTDKGYCPTKAGQTPISTSNCTTPPPNGGLPDCNAGPVCDANKCTAIDPKKCGTNTGKKVNCKYYDLRGNTEADCNAKEVPANEIPSCNYNCDATKNEVCDAGICKITTVQRCNNNGICEPPGETTSNCPGDCGNNPPPPPPPPPPQCQDFGQTCSSTSSCCTGQNLACKGGTCQCADGTSQNPYSCQGASCTRSSSTTCKSDSCNPADSKSCGTGVTPTPKIPSGSTSLLLTLGLDGLGTTGDNATPTGHMGSNKNPKTRTRDLTVVIKDKNGNTFTANPNINLVYDDVTSSPTYGKFKGTAVFQNLQTNQYTVNVTSTGFLTVMVPGILTINSETGNNAPSARMVNGNINNEDISKNVLDIQDYNILLGCMDDPDFSNTPAAFKTYCNNVATNQRLSNLNDDDKVDKNDWNLWIRELGHQYGAQ